MNFKIAKRLVFICALIISSCGPDGCDPTGSFGCMQYTSVVKFEIINTTSSDFKAVFSTCSCCHGGDRWEVASFKTVSKEITVVDEGGGDACDESAAFSRLSISSPTFNCTVEFLHGDRTIICGSSGCESTSRPFEKFRC